MRGIRVFSRIQRLPMILLAGLLLPACGMVSAGGPSTSCPAGTAQITVFDTAMQRVCGCTEASGQYFSGPGSLACTVKVGTVVYFNYSGIINSHQIAISGLYTSPVRTSSGTSQTDGYDFSSTGTFTFQDNFTNIGGTFTVTP